MKRCVVLEEVSEVAEAGGADVVAGVVGQRRLGRQRGDRSIARRQIQMAVEIHLPAELRHT
jgi:hypothetical protein